MADGYITAEIDANVSNYLRQFSEGLNTVLEFAAQQCRQILKSGVLPQIVFALAEKAGDGFPRSYRNHLALAIRELPIFVNHLGEGVFEIILDLDPLGDYEDLLRGSHQNAMLAESVSDPSIFEYSFRKTTRGLLRRAVLGNLYAEEDFLNPKERRTEWWNTAIVHGDTHTMVGANWNWTKPAIRTIDDAWQPENVPTFEQVASDRVNEAWLPRGVAPEWLLLEYGTPAGTEPVVVPQNFRETIREVMDCVCLTTIDEAVRAFEVLLSERQVIGVKGPQASPYNTLGQFVNYKDLFTKSVPNLSNCLALI